MSDSLRSPKRAWAGLLTRPVWSLLRALLPVIGVILFFTIVDFALHGRDATFWTKQNLQTISVQNAFVAIAALGMLLIIIAGGIDLSAGTAIALCATIIAWGMREDVAFFLAHGDNVAGAARKLTLSGSALRAGSSDASPAWRTTLQDDLARRRQRLAALLQIKLDQLRHQRELSGQPRRSEADETIEEVELALAAVNDPSVVIPVDPTWLRVLPNSPMSPWLALLMGLGAGMACGLFNGLLVVVLRVVPFIATLGTMTIYLGLAKIVAEETVIRPLPHQVPTWLGELAAVRPHPVWLQVSKGVWLALFLAAVVACVLRYTVFGRYVFAIGSNESTARLCGISVPLVKLAVYTLAGLFVGIASVCFFARLNSGSPTAGTGLELKFIAAVVIGGGSLSGGRGTVLGTLAGAAIMGVIASGCTLLGIRNPAQDIILGLIIVAAVTFDQFRQRREDRR